MWRRAVKVNDINSRHNSIHGLSLAFLPRLSYSNYMDKRTTNAAEKWFPCPVCLKPLDVRSSKRDKPYVICSACGVQMFIRERPGIAAFESLVEQGIQADVLSRIANLEQRYKMKCPDCGKQFWVRPELVAKNLFNSKTIGYRCPETYCQGVVAIGEQAS